MQNPHKLKFNSGFTLIELMITLAIAVVLITLAVPSFSLMINNNKVTSATNQFVSTLALARSEALKRSGNVSICESNAALTACATAESDYAKNGWLIFVDDNGDGDIDAGDDSIIKIGESIENITIKAVGAVAVNSFGYNLSGRIIGANSPKFKVLSSASNTAIRKKEVSINRIGRVRSKTL